MLNILIGDIIYFNKNEYLIGGIFKNLGDELKVVLIDKKNKSIIKDYKIIKNSLIKTHINQIDDFLDKNGEVLRKGDIFYDNDNKENENTWFLKQEICIPENNDFEELTYNKVEFKKDCVIQINKRKRSNHKDNMFEKANKILKEIFNKTGIKYKIIKQGD